MTDEDDLVELNNALASALDALLLLDLLLSVPNPAAGTMRSLMLSMGGFDDDGGLGLDTPVFPGLPGRPKSGGLPTGPSVIDFWLHQGGPVMRTAWPE